MSRGASRGTSAGDDDSGEGGTWMLRALAFSITVTAIAFFGVLAQANTDTDDPYAETGWTNPLDTGETLFGAMCASCHGIEGGGGFGPPLAGNPAVQSDSYVVRMIVLGGGGMPSFGPPQLTEEQITQVVNHISTSWGNDFEPVDEDTVREHIETHRGN